MNWEEFVSTELISLAFVCIIIRNINSVAVSCHRCLISLQAFTSVKDIIYCAVWSHFVKFTFVFTLHVLRKNSKRDIVGDPGALSWIGTTL